MVLRPIWGDPRIHCGVNCAAIGCPDLQARAFTAETAEALLVAAARACVNHPRGARVEAGRLTVSSIYAWFREDFGANEAGVIAHLKRYAGAALATALEAVTGIEDYEYDWALNDARADALALLPLPGATVPRPDQDRSDPHRGFDRACESGLRL